MRSYLPIVLLAAAALTACASSSDEGNSTGTTDRIERCVDRLLQAPMRQEMNDEVARRYARETYCARFERNGWIYDDGALTIAAHTSLEEGGTCAAPRAGEAATTMPCEEVRPPGPRILDCALLHHVRRIEVRHYIERLQREGAVECDDSTPLDNLGVSSVPIGSPG